MKNKLSAIISSVIIFFFFKCGTDFSDGRKLYINYCGNCHGTQGEGLELLYPSLIKSNKIKNPNEVACIINNGLSGKIISDNKVYNSTMAPIKLSEVELSNLLNYIQSDLAKTKHIINPENIKHWLSSCSNKKY